MQFQSEYYRLLDLLQIELTNEIIAEVVTLYDKLIDSTTPKTIFVVTNKLLSNTKFSSTCPITLLIARHLPRLLDSATKAMENETGLSIYHYFLSNLFRFKGIDYYLSDFLEKSANDSDKITIGLEYIKGCFGLNVNLEYINDVVAHRLQDLDCHSLHQIVTIYATLHQRQDQVMMTPSLLKAIVDVWYVKYILKSEKFTIPEDWWVIFPFLYAQSNQSLYISQFTSLLTLKYFYQLLENECNSMVLDTSPTALHLTSNEFAFFQFAEMDWLSIYKNSGMYQTETIVIFCGVSKIYLKQHSTAKDIVLCRLAQLVPDIYASPNIWKPCLAIINQTLSLTGNAVFAVDYTALGFDCLHRIQSLISVLESNQILTADIELSIAFVIQFCCMASILSCKYQSLVLEQLICIPLFIETLTELGQITLPNISHLERSHQIFMEEQLIALQAAAIYLKVILVRSHHFSKTNNTILDKFIPLNVHAQPKVIQTKFCKERQYLAVQRDAKVKDSSGAAFDQDYDFRTYSDLCLLYVLCLEVKVTLNLRKIMLKDYLSVSNLWDELFTMLTLPIIRQSKIPMGKHLLCVILELVHAFLEFCGDTDLIHFLIDPPFVERTFKSLGHFWHGNYLSKVIKKMKEFDVHWARKFPCTSTEDECETNESVIQEWLSSR